MTIKGSAILIVLVVSLASCSNRQTGEVSVKEDLIAKQLLQGIWVNDETEMPLMRIEGDTVYYANPQSAPVPFKVVHDTVFLYHFRSSRNDLHFSTGENQRIFRIL